MDSTLSCWLEPTQGFHTTFKTHIKARNVSADCTLRLVHEIPPGLFADPYELANYRHSYTFQLEAPVDLEAPVVAASPEFSSLSLNVTLPQNPKDGEKVGVVVEVPLHVRYGRAQPNGSYDQVEVPWPSGAWICAGGLSSETVILPVTLLSGARETIVFPVGNVDYLFEVEIGTAAVVLLASVVLLYRLYTTSLRLSNSKAKSERHRA